MVFTFMITHTLYIVCLNIEQYHKLAYVHSMLTSRGNVKPKRSYILAAVTLQCDT